MPPRRSKTGSGTRASATKDDDGGGIGTSGAGAGAAGSSVSPSTLPLSFQALKDNYQPRNQVVAQQQQQQSAGGEADNNNISNRTADEASASSAPPPPPPPPPPPTSLFTLNMGESEGLVGRSNSGSNNASNNVVRPDRTSGDGGGHHNRTSSSIGGGATTVMGGSMQHQKSLLPSDMGPLRPTAKRGEGLGLPSGAHIKRRPLSVPRRFGGSRAGGAGGGGGARAASRTRIGGGGGGGGSFGSPTTMSLQFGGGGADFGSPAMASLGGGGAGTATTPSTSALTPGGGVRARAGRDAARPLVFDHRRSDPSPAPSRRPRANRRKPISTATATAPATAPAPVALEHKSRGSFHGSPGTASLGGSVNALASHLLPAAANHSHFSSIVHGRTGSAVGAGKFLRQQSDSAVVGPPGKEERGRPGAAAASSPFQLATTPNINTATATAALGGKRLSSSLPAVEAARAREEAVRVYVNLCERFGEAPNPDWVACVGNATTTSGGGDHDYHDGGGVGGGGGGSLPPSPHLFSSVTAAAAGGAAGRSLSGRRPRMTAATGGKLDALPSHSGGGGGGGSSSGRLRGAAAKSRAKSPGGAAGQRRSSSVTAGVRPALNFSAAHACGGGATPTAAAINGGSNATASSGGASGGNSGNHNRNARGGGGARTVADIYLDRMTTYCDVHFYAYGDKMTALKQRRDDVADTVSRFVNLCEAVTGTMAATISTTSNSIIINGGGGACDSIHDNSSNGTTAVAVVSSTVSAGAHEQQLQECRVVARTLTEGLGDVQTSVVNLLVTLGENATDASRAAAAAADNSSNILSASSTGGYRSTTSVPPGSESLPPESGAGLGNDNGNTHHAESSPTYQLRSPDATVSPTTAASVSPSFSAQTDPIGRGVPVIPRLGIQDIIDNRHRYATATAGGSGGGMSSLPQTPAAHRKQVGTPKRGAMAAAGGGGGSLSAKAWPGSSSTAAAAAAAPAPPGFVLFVRSQEDEVAAQLAAALAAVALALAAIPRVHVEDAEILLTPLFTPSAANVAAVAAAAGLNSPDKSLHTAATAAAVGTGGKKSARTGALTPRTIGAAKTPRSMGPSASVGAGGGGGALTPRQTGGARTPRGGFAAAGSASQSASVFALHGSTASMDTAAAAAAAATPGRGGKRPPTTSGGSGGGVETPRSRRVSTSLHSSPASVTLVSVAVPVFTVRNECSVASGRGGGGNVASAPASPLSSSSALQGPPLIVLGGGSALATAAAIASARTASSSVGSSPVPGAHAKKPADGSTTATVGKVKSARAASAGAGKRGSTASSTATATSRKGSSAAAGTVANNSATAAGKKKKSSTAGLASGKASPRASGAGGGLWAGPANAAVAPADRQLERAKQVWATICNNVNVNHSHNMAAATAAPSPTNAQQQQQQQRKGSCESETTNNIVMDNNSSLSDMGHEQRKRISPSAMDMIAVPRLVDTDGPDEQDTAAITTTTTSSITAIAFAAGNETAHMAVSPPHGLISTQHGTGAHRADPAIHVDYDQGDEPHYGESTAASLTTAAADDSSKTTTNTNSNVIGSIGGTPGGSASPDDLATNLASTAAPSPATPIPLAHVCARSSLGGGGGGVAGSTSAVDIDPATEPSKYSGGKLQPLRERDGSANDSPSRKLKLDDDEEPSTSFLSPEAGKALDSHGAGAATTATVASSADSPTARHHQRTSTAAAVATSDARTLHSHNSSMSAITDTADTATVLPLEPPPLSSSSSGVRQRQQTQRRSSLMGRNEAALRVSRCWRAHAARSRLRAAQAESAQALAAEQERLVKVARIRRFLVRVVRRRRLRIALAVMRVREATATTMTTAVAVVVRASPTTTAGKQPKISANSNSPTAAAHHRCGPSAADRAAKAAADDHRTRAERLAEFTSLMRDGCTEADLLFATTACGGGRHDSTGSVCDLSSSTTPTNTPSSATGGVGGGRNSNQSAPAMSSRERFLLAKEQRKSISGGSGGGAAVSDTAHTAPKGGSLGLSPSLTTQLRSTTAATSTSSLRQPQPRAPAGVTPLPLAASGISNTAAAGYSNDTESFEVSVLHRLLHAPQPLLYALRVATDRYPEVPPMGYIRPVDPKAAATAKSSSKGGGKKGSTTAAAVALPPSSMSPDRDAAPSPRVEVEALAEAALRQQRAAAKRRSDERQAREGVYTIPFARLRKYTRYYYADELSPFIAGSGEDCESLSNSSKNIVASGLLTPPSVSHDAGNRLLSRCATESSGLSAPRSPVAASSGGGGAGGSTATHGTTHHNSHHHRQQQRTIPLSVRYDSYVDANEIGRDAPVVKPFARPFERWGMAEYIARRVFTAAAIYAWKILFSHTPHDDLKQRSQRTDDERQRRLARVGDRDRMILHCYAVHSEREWLREASKDLSFVGQIWNPKRFLDPNTPDIDTQCKQIYDFVEDFLYQCFPTVNALDEVPQFLAGAGIYCLLKEVFHIQFAGGGGGGESEHGNSTVPDAEQFATLCPELIVSAVDAKLESAAESNVIANGSPAHHHHRSRNSTIVKKRATGTSSSLARSGAFGAAASSSSSGSDESESDDNDCINSNSLARTVNGPMGLEPGAYVRMRNHSGGQLGEQQWRVVQGFEVIDLIDRMSRWDLAVAGGTSTTDQQQQQQRRSAVRSSSESAAASPTTPSRRSGDFSGASPIPSRLQAHIGPGGGGGSSGTNTKGNNSANTNSHNATLASTFASIGDHLARSAVSLATPTATTSPHYSSPPPPPPPAGLSSTTVPSGQDAIDATAATQSRVKLVKVPDGALAAHAARYDTAATLKERESEVLAALAQWAPRPGGGGGNGGGERRFDFSCREVAVLYPRRFLVTLSEALAFELLGQRIDLDACEDLDDLE